ncbi:hypothetical protein AB0C33_05790 [Nonomuraea sp. NPDC048881]|uniref:hypothetical protein n=1 Tax=Nonomuraea sp. NPDC048881 TaxID=3155030 RepID=UPI0033FD3641
MHLPGDPGPFLGGGPRRGLAGPSPAAATLESVANLAAAAPAPARPTSSGGCRRAWAAQE